YVLRELFKLFYFFFSSRRRHTRFSRDWSSDVCSSDLLELRHDLVQRGVADHDQGRVARLHPALVEGEQVVAVERRDRGLGAAAEIGRASCRERVEVEGSGVLVRGRSE